MDTLEIEIAMMEHLGVRVNVVVPNLSFGIAQLHECDLLALSKSNYATEIEIKMSKSDLLADAKKSHGHRHNHIKKLYFAVPSSLKEVALEVIPRRAGLFIIEENPSAKIVRKVKECSVNKKAHKWTVEERYKLAELGTMRILGLKKKLLVLR